MDTGDIARTDYVTDDSDMVVTYRVFLVCWEEANGQQLTSAAMRMLQRFSGAEAIETVATSDGLGALAQTQVRIPSNRPILG